MRIIRIAVVAGVLLVVGFLSLGFGIGLPELAALVVAAAAVSVLVVRHLASRGSSRDVDHVKVPDTA